MPKEGHRLRTARSLRAVNEILGPRFEQAIAYACLLHADQRRKGTDVPYLAHLMGVVGLMIEDAAAVGELREDDAIAAVLHDAAEDRGGEPRLADIEARFGERVAQVVRACSDSLEPGGDKAPWRERKEAYLAHLADAREDVLRVSLADKLHNARALQADYRAVGPDLWKRFNSAARTAATQLWYYRSLVEIFAARRPGRQADELAWTVGELERLVREQEGEAALTEGSGS